MKPVSLTLPILLAPALLAAGPGSAAAEGWAVAKVSGQAWAGTAGQRVDLTPGMPLASGTTVITAERSRVLLRRGTETIQVGPVSVIAISETPDRQLDTTVLEKAGTVTFDVEKRNVQHFAVETPTLAAVVKGTHFTVSVGSADGKVAVSRGTVQVTALASGQATNVVAGQHATVDNRGGFTVGGAGPHVATIASPPRAALVSAVTEVTPASLVSASELAGVAGRTAPSHAAPTGLFYGLRSLFSGTSSDAPGGSTGSTDRGGGTNPGVAAAVSNSFSSVAPATAATTAPGASVVSAGTIAPGSAAGQAGRADNPASAAPPSSPTSLSGTSLAGTAVGSPAGTGFASTSPAATAGAQAATTSGASAATGMASAPSATTPSTAAPASSAPSVSAQPASAPSVSATASAGPASASVSAGSAPAAAAGVSAPSTSTASATVSSPVGSASAGASGTTHSGTAGTGLGISVSAGGHTISVGTSGVTTSTTSPSNLGIGASVGNASASLGMSGFRAGR